MTRTITGRRKDPYLAKHKPRMDSDEVGESCVTMQLCVHDWTIGGILSFFYLSIVYNQFASGLILCETASSTVICGTPHANYIHEFSPGGGVSGPTDRGWGYALPGVMIACDHASTVERKEERRHIFFSPQQKVGSNGNFKEYLNFPKFQKGSNFFQWVAGR